MTTVGDRVAREGFSEQMCKLGLRDEEEATLAKVFQAEGIVGSAKALSQKKVWYS